MTTHKIRIEVSDGVNDVLEERIRQLREEGYTAAHDDTHRGSELALMAVGLIGQAVEANYAAPDVGELIATAPWKDVKGKNPRDSLVKAAALLLAELERLDRAAGL